jgi:hypothetical protein
MSIALSVCRDTMIAEHRSIAQPESRAVINVYGAKVE